MHATGGRAGQELWRQITTYRAAIFALVAAVLLITPISVPGSVTAAWFVALFVLALAGSLAHWFLRNGHAHWVLVSEAVAVGLMAAAGQAVGAPWLGLYIVVPAMWAGSTLPLARALPIGLLPAATLLAAGVAEEGSISGAYAQWWLLSLSITLVAVILARIAARRAKPDYYYDRALPLLKQLAPIARRLPLGLERATLLDSFAADVQSIAPSCELIFATPSGTRWFADYQSAGADSLQSELASLGEVGNMRAAAVLRRDRSAGTSLAAVPIRRADAVYGVLLVAAASKELSRPSLERMQTAAALLALQLEASSVFNGIREDATAEERARLSRQIHDGVAQDLAGLAYSLDSAAIGEEGSDQTAAHWAAQEVRRLVEELRYSIFDLRTRPDGADSFGTTVANYLREVGDRSGLRVILELDDGSGRVPPAAAAELFRILQEAVTNARKHSGATALRVLARVTEDEVLVQVSDNGSGMEDTRAQGLAGEGIGLTVMRERADRLGAALTIESDPRGTIVECRLGVGPPRREIPAEPRAEASPALAGNRIVRLAQGAWHVGSPRQGAPVVAGP